VTRERWEVTAVNPDNGETADEITYEQHVSATVRAKALRRAGWVPRIVHVRTYRVEVVYAWRQILGGYYDRHGLIVFTTKSARIHTDPLGKHSRRRAKKAALAARPTGPCVLVAVRRRVKE